jgi:flavin reductase (DIM6/NTAB) family NADH-FMN oxidoreductase RutF
MVYFAEPIQTVLVSCRANVEIMGKEVLKDNMITLDWHMPVSFEPSLYAISVGKSRFSRLLIEKSKCFVVNFMPFSLKDKVLFCGRKSGRHMDKFKETGLKKEEGESVDCPRIADACAGLECEVVNSLEAGDHTIFVGKVLKEIYRNDAPRLFHLSEDEFVQVGE